MKKKIVTIGGGTGSFTFLTELKELKDIEITAVVAMSDSGGSTGKLRVDMGVLPAGDVRQALVALSRSPEKLRELFTYRYGTGDMSGHTFGNLFLSTLEKVTGSFESAILQAGKLLNVKGRIYPVTLHRHDLIVKMPNGESIIGEGEVDNRYVIGYERMYLSDGPLLNPNVEKAISEADIVLIAPGNFYCSIIPNFLVIGLTDALQKSDAKKVMIANLLSKEGHTTDFDITKFMRELEVLSGGFIPDTVMYNTNKKLSSELQQIIDQEGGELVELGDIKEFESKGVNFIGENIIDQVVVEKNDNDTVKRSLLRHDAKKVIEVLGV